MENLQLPIVNEVKVIGRAERILIDKEAKLWQRISRWTYASDVECSDGENIETKLSNMTNTINTKLSNMTNTINNLIESFQDGVNKIFNYLKGLGFTPNPNSPDGICNAIQNVYNQRYNNGRTQGRADVISNPSAYGINVGVDIKSVNFFINDAGNSKIHVSASVTYGDGTVDHMGDFIIIELGDRDGSERVFTYERNY